MVMLILTIAFMNPGVLVSADAYSHRYKKGDEVPLYANKVGPYSNPSETYAYFDLPFCPPDKLSKKENSLGEALNGDNLVSAAYKLPFLEEKESDVLCRRRLGKEEVRRFKNAVAQDYYFQMYYDDLPMWAFIGEVRWRGAAETDYKYHVFTHIQFEVVYNGDRVIAIHPLIQHWSTADVTDEKEIDVEFLYTVTWKETNITFEKRMDMYYMPPRQLAIHWFSITNSCVTILFIIGGLVTIYLRVLKRDILKYSKNEESIEFQETGWKVLHGDVFRYPKHKSLFAAALGSGTQLFLVTLCVLTLGIVGVFHLSDRGVIPRTIVIIYAITSGISGFTAVSFYHQLEGSNWIRNLLLTGGILCGPFFITFCFLNTIAIIYGSIAALSSGTITMILLLWIFLDFPSLLLGGILGKNIKLEFQAPCRTKCPRDIPQLRWYRGVLFQMALAGILPFSVIYIQLVDIFTSLWDHFMYKTYHTLSIVFILLIIVTALVSIALTYFQLAAEDHEWWWRSFLCGGSTGLYIFGYTIYYYFQVSYMKGLMQTSFLFGYMACISFGVFLMLGTVGFRASSLFVRLIYGCIKCE